MFIFFITDLKKEKKKKKKPCSSQEDQKETERGKEGEET